MHWELWSIDTANLIGTYSSEDEGLSLVQELLSRGWDADNLTLLFEDESQPPEALPAAMSGTLLAERAGMARTQNRRSA